MKLGSETLKKKPYNKKDPSMSHTLLGPRPECSRKVPDMVDSGRERATSRICISGEGQKRKRELTRWAG